MSDDSDNYHRSSRHCGRVNWPVRTTGGTDSVVKRGKKYDQASKLIEPDKFYEPKEATAKLKQVAYANFDETVDVHFKLGIDPRHADQQVRSTASLPHGTGKQVRVVVF